jgi:hypothetical protein
MDDGSEHHELDDEVLKGQLIEDEPLDTNIPLETQSEALKVFNPYRKPFLVLVIILCISLLGNAGSSYLTWDVATNTNVIVRDIDKRNSPETQKAQAEALEQIIMRVDCNTRKIIEEALNDIAAENPGLAFNIKITGPRCSKTSTTTTVAP